MADPQVLMSLIVDDPPVNSSYWIRRQSEEFGIAREPRGSFGTFVADWRAQEPGAIIPNAFWRKFADWALAAGVKGKFTLLPCPSGLGYIDDAVEGYTAEELAELISVVRDDIARNFDITPEILTHSMAWDIDNDCMLPVTEYDWMSKQSEETLARYMAKALSILRNVGISPTGITQPCNFRGDEAAYARAVLTAMKQVCGITHTFYFLHVDAESVPVEYPLMVADPEKDEYVVSMVSGVRADEPFWASLYGEGDVHEMADYFISADGASGRLVDLVNGGGPAVFHCHGQTIFSNGTEKGFRSLREVVVRVERHLGDRVRWATTSEVAEEVIRRSSSSH